MPIVRLQLIIHYFGKLDTTCTSSALDLQSHAMLGWLLFKQPTDADDYIRVKVLFVSADPGF